MVFDPDGFIRARESRRYPTHYAPGVRAEQDPGDWMAAAAAAVAAVRNREPDAVNLIAGIGVTAHMHALVLLDRHGEPVRRALVLGDRRAAADAAAITAELTAPGIHQTTGATLDASMPAAEIRWLRRCVPEKWRDVALVVGAKDYIRMQLTGDRRTEPIDACATALYDIKRRRWWPEMLRTAGVDVGHLPDVVDPTTIAGPLLLSAATTLGLTEGTPVVVGAGDDIEVLAGGLIDPGDALEHLGTTGSIFVVTTEPIEDPSLTLELYPHALEDRWVAGGSITTAGAAIAWAASILGFDGPAAMLECLDTNRPRHDESRRAPTQPLFLPSLAGDRSPVRDPSALGAWVGLELSSRGELLGRATYEGVAFALRRVLDAIESVAGHQRRVVVSAGGTDVDPRWMALRSATYRRPLTAIDSPEPTALGLLAIVLTGVGHATDVRSAVAAISRLAGEVAPPKGRDALSSRYQAWLQAVEAMRPVWSSMHQPENLD